MWLVDQRAILTEGPKMAGRRRGAPRRHSRKGTSKRSFKCTCAKCGKELMLSVPPPPGEPLVCLDCFRNEERE